MSETTTKEAVAKQKKSAAQPALTADGKKKSKAQIQLDENAATAKKLLDLWLKYRALILLAFSDKPIKPEQEQKFLEVTGNLQKQARALIKVTPRDIDFGIDDIGKLMRGAVSVQHLRELPNTDKERLNSDWHSIYILITRTVGAMDTIAEGYHHNPKEVKEVGLRGIKTGGGGVEAKIPLHKNPSAITIIVVLVFVTAFLLNYLDVIDLPF